MLGFLHRRMGSYKSFCMVTGFNVDVGKDRLTNASTMGIIAPIFIA